MHSKAIRSIAGVQPQRGRLTLLQRPPARVSIGAASANNQNHLFVDTVRFWSTLAIVALHSTGLFAMLGKGSPHLAHAVATPFKFGTIAFFLASGFLLGERLENCRPLAYLRKRLKKVFLPWLFWFTLAVAFFLTAEVIHHQVTLSFSLDTLGIIGRKFVSCLFTSAFWFVPNLLLSLCILLLFRKRLADPRFGAALLAINLFYVVNIYTRWFPSSHTEAMLGFVFYLWLGTYGARHFGRLTSWISRVSLATLLAFTMFAASIAWLEAHLLSRLGSPDSMNTLRLSNQIFSVAVVLMLLKLRRPTWPRFVNVRNNTFGLYLTHTMILSIVLKTAVHLLSRSPDIWLQNSNGGLIALWITAVVVTYSICLLITKAVDSQPGLRWLIGSSAPKRGAQTSPRLATALELPA